MKCCSLSFTCLWLLCEITTLFLFVCLFVLPGNKIPVIENLGATEVCIFSFISFPLTLFRTLRHFYFLIFGKVSLGHTFRYFLCIEYLTGPI